MPIRADIEGIGILEFPDDTPEDIINRTVKKEILGTDRQVAQREIDTADRFIGAVDTVAPILRRGSLGGLGELSGSWMTDVVTPRPAPEAGESIGEYLSRALLPRATIATLKGQPIPEDQRQALDESVWRRALVGAAESIPTVGAAVALGPGGLPAWASMGAAMGAQAFEASEGDPVSGAKGAAMGAAIPFLGAAGRIGAGAATGAAVNRGATALASTPVQRTIEAVGAQVPIQGMFLADLVSSDQYQNATPEQRRDLLAEFTISNAIFGIPDAIQATRGTPLARRFESPDVQAARMLENQPVGERPVRRGPFEIDEVTGEMVSGPVQIQPSRMVETARPMTVYPGGAIRPTPVVEQALRDAMSILETPGKGDAMRALEREAAPPEIIAEPAIGERRVEGGEVSFRQTAPDASSIMVEPTREAFARETAAAAAASQPAPVEIAGTMEGVSYRPPGVAPTPREAQLARARSAVEEGLTIPQEQPPEPAPDIGQYPEGPDPRGTLSKAQRRKELARIEREAGIRPGSHARAIEWLESKRMQPDPNARYSGVPPHLIFNAALDTAIAAVRGGQAVSKALDTAVAEAKSKYGDAVNETRLRASLMAGMPPDIGGSPAPAAPTESRLPAFDPGPGQKVRRLAERASVSREVPRPIREAIRKDPRALYDPQVVQQEVERISTKTDTELAAGMADLNSNTSVMEGLQLVQRAIARGDQTGAENLIMQLAQRGTTLGQLVNQFKLLKGVVPENVSLVIDKVLQDSGYDPLTAAQKSKITELSRANIEAEAKRRVADADYLGNPTPENWQKVFAADEAAAKTSVELNAELVRMHPRKFSDVLVAILQGNLMTPISQVANLADNAIRMPVAGATRAGAAMLDAIESAVTGKPRTITMHPISGAIAKLKAMPHAASVARDIAIKGADTSRYEAGQYGGVQLNAPRAMRELRDIFIGQANLPTKGGRIPMMDVVNRGIEATFGLPADVMLRGLGAMDSMFRYPERARLAHEAALRIGKTPEEAIRAGSRPDLILPPDVLKQVEFDASRSVLQQENIGTRAMAALNRVFKEVPGLYLMTRSVLPFQKTPINLMAELLSYFPPTGLGKLVGDVRKGNRREANLQASKVVIGSIITAAAQWLYQKGVISPPLDASDESQKVRLGAENALPPNSLNMTGLERAIKGEDSAPRPGDHVIDLRRMGLGGGLLYLNAWANRQVEKKRTGDSSLTQELAVTAPTATASWALNQTFLYGVSDFIKKVQQDQMDSYIQTWLSGVSSVALPNTLTAVSRALRDSKPDFRDDNALQAFGNKLNERANMLGFSVPLGRDTKALPLRIDLWGRPMPETPPGANPWVYHFFDITRSRSLPDDPVAVELYKLWRQTTDTRVFPSLPDRKLSIGGRETEPLEFDRYQELAKSIGQTRRALVERLIDSPAWPQLNEADKLKVLTKVYDAGREFGRDAFIASEVQQGRRFTPRTPRRGPPQ